MQNKGLVSIAVLLGACSSQSASLENARNQLIQTQTDYRDCMNGGSGEITNQCEAKLVAADNAERTYVDFAEIRCVAQRIVACVLRKGLMSALGHERTFAVHQHMSAFSQSF